MSIGDTLRRLRRERGMSQESLAIRCGWSRAYIGHWETGRAIPDVRQVDDLDRALSARGELIGTAYLDRIDAVDSTPLETTDLLARLRSSDTSRDTLDRLEAVTFELCCRYPYSEAPRLRAEAQAVIRDAAGMLRRPTGLREHRELLASAGWLALLVGCLEYDMGLRRASEATRTMARDLAHEAGHTEIAGWAAEMGAWFALTQGRYSDVMAETQQGLAVAGDHYVGVQLLAQEAKALARIGDQDDVRRALDAGHAALQRMPSPDRPEHHFVIDPSKWDFYAMDTYRLAGDDDRASQHAHEVLRAGSMPDGSERSPMRMAEARVTLGVAAARAGDLDAAHAYGIAAMAGDRRSLPSLVMVAAELESALSQRFPDATLTHDFRDRLAALRE